MQQKNLKVSSAEIDIEALIKQGVETHMKLKELAEQHISSIKKDNAFDFSMESIDTFKFQEKDFREEKKRVQEMIQKQ